MFDDDTRRRSEEFTRSIGRYGRIPKRDVPDIAGRSSDGGPSHRTVGDGREDD